jgi:PrtD family type I secretion system ABC transporter
MSKHKSPLARAVGATLPALTATFILSLFINAVILVSPIYSMQVYDRVLNSRNLVTLAMLSAIALVLMLLYGILEYARSGVLVRAGVMFETCLRRPLFEAMMRAEMDPEQRQGQRVIRDAEMIRECLANGTATVICDLPWAPLFVALCFILHPGFGAVAAAGALILFLLAVLTELTTRAGVEATSRLSNEAYGFAASALRNCEVVRGLGMGDTVLDRWCDQQAAAVASNARAHERSAVLVAASRFARVTVQSATLGVGAWLAVTGEISPGAIMASSIIIGRALAPVEQIVGHWKRIIACRSACRRLKRLFDCVPAAAEHVQLPAPVGHVRVENVVVVPPGASRPAVRGVSFDLAAGESLAIVGSSASGKSSLARALAGVWPLTGGDIRIDGAALNQWDPNKLGKHFGYLPQDVELFAGTVADNIARLDAVDHAAVVAAAKLAGAHDVILRLPKGYDTPIGDGGMALSGGMRQRVGLARALYGAPRLVILDEPNSNLDEDGERALAQAIARLRAARCTVIVVTHRPHLLAHLGKLLVMSLGTVIAFGERDDVIARMRCNKVAAVVGAAQAAAK